MNLSMLSTLIDGVPGRTSNTGNRLVNRDGRDLK
jgi:hypothetical protein